jgi:hypothetical protein
MKTSKIIITLLLTAGMAFSIQSCKKDSSESSSSTPADDNAVETQQASDESEQAQESEYAMKDADDAMANSGFGKTFVIIGATIDSVMLDQKIVITYNGNNSDGSRYRTGKISIQLTSGSHWRDQNAVATVTFTDYKVKRNSTGKTTTLNGTYVVTNVSGGLVVLLSPGNSVTHRMTGSIKITFDNGTERTWEITRQRVVGLTANSSAYITMTGTGAKNGFTHVAVAGMNRAGSVFYTTIDTPVTYSSACSWVAVSGKASYKGMARDLDVTYGVDAAGNVVTGTCPYGYKLNWTNVKGEAKAVVVKY